MNIPDYLKSEQARADVGALLNKTPDAAGSRGRWHSIPEPLACLTATPDRAWTRVDILFAEIDATSPARAYFRPDADRFIVTDLGEAVRALRLRTGAIGISYERGQSMLHVAGDLRLGWSGEFAVEKCTAANLPAAICRVMFAAYEVSRL